MAESWITDLEIANNKEELQALTRPINTRHLILRGDSNVTDKEFSKLLAWGYITKLTIIGNDALTDEGFASAIRGIKGLEELHLERVHGVTQNGLMKALHGSAIVSCGKSLKRVNIECCNGMRMKDVDYKALKENIFKCDNYPNVEKSKEFTFNIRDNENEYSSSKTYQEFTSKEGGSRSSQTSLFENFANEKISQSNFQPLFLSMMENILARTLDRALDRALDRTIDNTIDNTLDRAFANRVSRQQFVDRMMENLLSRAAEKPANGFSRQQSTPNR